MYCGRRQLLAMAAGSLVMKGQTAAPKEFEVASIKPSAPMTGGMFRVGVEMLPGGRISMTGMTVKLLIQQTYGVRDFQIVGAPAWLGSERYDITAKPEGAATPEEMKPMLKALLADRFQFKFHRETKDLPTYSLVVAKNGPKLHASEAVHESDGPKGGQMMRMGRGQFNAQGAPIASLANRLGDLLGRSVIDKTELKGDYDIKLEWTPDENEGGMFRGADPHAEARPDPMGPSLMTALQEQLGLKLESTRGPVEILVIERVEKASEN